MPTEIIEVAGHIVDSLILPKVLDLLVEAGADYRLDEVEIGRTNRDTSRARIIVTHDDQSTLDALIEKLAVHGASPVTHDDAELVPADRDGVLPLGFHSTTNLDTDVRIGRR